MANSIGFRFYNAFVVASGVRVPGAAKYGDAVDSSPAGRPGLMMDVTSLGEKSIE